MNDPAIVDFMAFEVMGATAPSRVSETTWGVLLELHLPVFGKQVLVSGGHVRSYWKNHRGTRLGTYYRVVYPHEGRRRSLYLSTGPVSLTAIRGSLDSKNARRRS